MGASKVFHMSLFESRVVDIFTADGLNLNIWTPPNLHTRDVLLSVVVTNKGRLTAAILHPQSFVKTSACASSSVLFLIGVFFRFRPRL